MSPTGWIMTVLGVLGVALAALAGHAVRRPTRPCGTCAGVGIRRGRRGRWASHCGRCRGSGQVDGWSTTALVGLTRGRWLPRAGSAAEGRMHGTGYVFAGSHPGGAWRALDDPADTRLRALADRRVPAAERRVQRREAAHTSAQGLARVWTWLRLVVARRTLRRATQAAERHAYAIADRAAGYRGAARRPSRRRPG